MRLEFETDAGIPVRASLGLIVLQTDETIEHEFRGFLDGLPARLYHSRVPSAPDITPESLARMEAELPASARLLPPTVTFDVIGYGCTSGATVIGEEAVAAAVRTVHPDSAVTNPLTALKAACRSLGVRRLGFVTPYVAAVSEAMRDALEAGGIGIAGYRSFDQLEERVVARIAPASIRSAIVEAGRAAPCDAVFASCTNLRAAGVIAEAEAELGRPVLTSNQVLAWHMLRLAGLDAGRSGLGALFESPLAA